MKAFLKYFILTVTAFGLGAGIAYRDRLKKTSPSESEISPAKVNVLTLQETDVTLTKSYIGYVTPIYQVSVVPFINGFVETVVVKGGQEVKAGDLLFTLEQDSYLADLELAKAAVIRATAQYENSKLYYDRVVLAGDQAVSPSDIDKAKTDFLAASAALTEAIANQKKAQVNYDYTFVYAPIDGKVGDVSLSIGDYLSPESESVMKVIQTTPIRVVFSLSDKEYLNEMLKHDTLPFQGERIRLKLANQMIYNQTGHIEYIANELSENTSSVPVWASFDNPQNALLAKSYVTVLIESTEQKALLVPRDAVHLGEEKNSVYLVDNADILQEKTVILGPVFQNSYIIKGGLKKGDRVVLDNIDSHQMGEKVTPVNQLFVPVSTPPETIFPTASERKDVAV